MAEVLHTVIAVSGTTVRLADTEGAVTDIGLIELSAAEDFEVVRASSRTPVPPTTPLEGLPEAVAAEALWWEQHIVEVLRGVPPQAPAGTKPKPEYDPAVVSLTRREQAKAAELTAAGWPVTPSAITKRRRRYEARGVVGMVDHRSAKPVSAHGRVDTLVVEAMQKAVAEAAQDSTRTATYLFWRTGQILEAEHGRGAVELPSQRSLYRLLEKLSAGKHTTGSARTRRSLADRPDGPFGERSAAAPGEHAELEPRLAFTIDGDHDPAMTLQFTGPTALRRLTGVELAIRDDSGHHGHSGLAGSTSPEELAAVIWGPLRFRPGIDVASEGGRTAGVFPLELNESRKVAMDPTLVPHWYGGGRPAWWRKWTNQPVRLWVTCHADGHRPWTTSRDIMPDQDIIDALIG